MSAEVGIFATIAFRRIAKLKCVLRSLQCDAVLGGPE
jgi:hypothetical protein